MSLLKPTVLALDSSQLGQLARDMFERDPGRREVAHDFVMQLDQRGLVLAVSYHHIQELLSHDNEDRLSERVRFLQSLKLVAVIASVQHDAGVGSVVDIQAREVLAAYENPAFDAVAVRDIVAPRVFALRSGGELIQPFLDSWSEVRAEFAEQIRKNGARVAILRSDFAGNASIKIVDMLQGSARSMDDINARLALLQKRLADDMAQRGDKRMGDAAAAAKKFLSTVRAAGLAAIAHEDPALAILLMNDVDLAEVGPETTVGDVGAHGAYRRKLRLLNRVLGLSWDALKVRVQNDRLPCGVIQQAIARFHPDVPEWDGSELSDRHLACLAAYADVTYVDRRTSEAFRQANEKLPVMPRLVRRVLKARPYAVSLPD